MTRPQPQPRAPERIALVRLSHLGDVVHALPVLHALRSWAPHARIAWIVQSEFAPLLHGMPGLDEVIPFERRGGLLSWWRLRRALSRFGAELAVDCQGNWKSAIATILTGARRRVGMARGDWREPHAAWLVGEHAERAVALDANAARPHAVERMLQLARHLTGESGVDDGQDSFHLSLTPAEREAGHLALESRLGESAAAGLMILHLGSPGDPRTWPAESFAALAGILASRGHPVLILSGPAEAESGAALQEALAHVRGISHWVGQSGLRLLASVFAASSERGGRLFAADSGPMHLAWACGLPVTLVAGPQDPLATGPWPLASETASPHFVVTSTEGQLDCIPCLRRTCKLPGAGTTAPCMAKLDPADVAERGTP